MDHKVTSCFDKPFGPYGLVCAIEWALNAPHYNKLCQNVKEKVLREFDCVVVAKKYIELYEDILKND